MIHEVWMEMDLQSCFQAFNPWFQAPNYASKIQIYAKIRNLFIEDQPLLL
jgi:hypothetical protein